MCVRISWLSILAPLVLGVALLFAILALHHPVDSESASARTKPPAPPPSTSRFTPTPQPSRIPAPAIPVRQPDDPVFKRWTTSILQRDARGVTEAQAAFMGREDNYRDQLVALAREDPEPRVRAFTVTLLGRFRQPPAEGFFIERLSDRSDYPRESAIAALEGIGTRSCCDALDGVAGSDPVDRIRAAAAAAAKALRAK